MSLQVRLFASIFASFSGGAYPEAAIILGGHTNGNTHNRRGRPRAALALLPDQDALDIVPVQVPVRDALNTIKSSAEQVRMLWRAVNANFDDRSIALLS